MKRNERRLLEEKLRYVAMEDVKLDPERDRQMLEEAKARFLQQDADIQTKTTSVGHQIGRRVLIVSAAAVVLLVLSFGFSVLMPESVSHARGFMRSAAIWVNNTLHLGYEFEEPIEDISLLSGEDVTFSSLEQASEELPYQLFCFNDPYLVFQSVSVIHTATSSQIVISYGDESANCQITLDPTTDNTLTNLNSNTHTIVPWQYGELECWQSASIGYALTYYAGTEIAIKGLNLPYDDFLAMCQTLKPFN